MWTASSGACSMATAETFVIYNLLRAFRVYLGFQLLGPNADSSNSSFCSSCIVPWKIHIQPHSLLWRWCWWPIVEDDWADLSYHTRAVHRWVSGILRWLRSMFTIMNLPEKYTVNTIHPPSLSAGERHLRRPHKDQCKEQRSRDLSTFAFWYTTHSLVHRRFVPN